MSPGVSQLAGRINKRVSAFFRSVNTTWILPKPPPLETDSHRSLIPRAVSFEVPVVRKYSSLCDSHRSLCGANFETGEIAKHRAWSRNCMPRECREDLDAVEWDLHVSSASFSFLAEKFPRKKWDSSTNLWRADPFLTKTWLSAPSLFFGNFFPYSILITSRE